MYVKRRGEREWVLDNFHNTKSRRDHVAVQYNFIMYLPTEYGTIGARQRELGTKKGGEKGIQSEQYKTLNNYILN